VKVDLEEIRRIRDRLKEINSVPLESIEWTESHNELV
jgi:hypothetical protein